MKKILILLMSLSSGFVFSQQVTTSYDLLDRLLASATVSNSVNSSSGKSLRYEEISGSPYSDPIFKNAEISKIYHNVLVRYNYFKDEIEFKNDKTGEIMIIPKDDKFKTIEILSPKQKIVLLNLNGEQYGYYYELVYGNYSLYKKTKVNFIDAKPATNPYRSDQPASFSKPLTSYYIVNGNKSIKNPKNQKDLIQQMPDKKEVLTSFFKENKIKFDKEEDMKKLVIFLNQN